MMIKSRQSWYLSGYSDWNAWGDCDELCGGGKQSRNRTCNKGEHSTADQQLCENKGLGPAVNHTICNDVECRGKDVLPFNEGKV